MSRGWTIFWLVFGLIQSVLSGLHIYLDHHVVFYTIMLFLFALTVGGNIVMLVLDEYDN